MPSFVFSTKAKTLESLSLLVSNAKVLPIYRFTVAEFSAHKKGVINAIQKNFEQELLIVRSSHKNEDSLETSNAGHFKTVLDVAKSNEVSLTSSIEEVIASYEICDVNDEVLVQPMLRDIKISGVVFTSDIDTLAPYYIINYDVSGKSDTVASGLEGDLKTFICYKESPVECNNNDLKKVCNACKELEEITGNAHLDIEFAVDGKGDLYIFQCRPIAIKNKEDLSQIDLADSLLKIHKKIKKLSFPHPNLLGDKAMFGVMPDWNPAEIIGVKPKQLSLSLYKELVTDSVWAYQRDNYGYRNLRSHPLLISFLGMPYIDVRVDFNSFIPKNLNEKIAKKLFAYYMSKLDAMPTHHDKVEFEVVHSCYYLNLPDRLRELLDYGFNENEIKRIEFSLLNITNDIICPEHGLYKRDLEKIEILKKKYDTIIESDLPLIEKIYWLVEDCKRFGTLPFAGVARAAFIGIQFLQSFVDLGIMTISEYDVFMNSLNTVAKKLNADLCKLAGKGMSRKEFLEQYGHLRPNTYDILSLRYDENFEHYFSDAKIVQNKVETFEFSVGQLERINTALVESGLMIDADRLIRFIKEAVEGREYAKFIFTKSLSEILRQIKVLGEKVGMKREKLVHLDIKTILNLYATLDHRDVNDGLLMDIEKNKEAFNYTKAVKLPTLIRGADDIYAFFLEDEEPNFITLKMVEAYIVMEDELRTGNLENRIAFIKSADPGYDYLFSKNIAGLVTQFGGANSHMAIRCAELGIPAVIGAGEKKFNRWSKAGMLALDCANRQVRIIL
ncbi:MAG: PEP-utilizing enzyme [Deltaproteobacteria bacterium]|nr:PEP-utilizing enzyme [Deltaproteobacteria bacterium]